MTILTNASGASGGILRFAKIGRMLRLLGLMRLVHLSAVLERVASRHVWLRSKTINISKLIFLILWINHLISCAWFALGRLNSGDTGTSWVDQAVSGSGDLVFRSSSFVFQYSTSLHWSLTQMTPASMQVVPVNTLEREFNIVVIFVGILMGATLVSSISATLSQWKAQRQDYNRKMETLRNFLRETDCSHHIKVVTETMLARRLKETKPLVIQDVAAVSQLSISTKSQLLYEICVPGLQRMSFFRVCIRIDRMMVTRLCHEAISFTPLASRDMLFQPRTLASAAYVLMSGTIQYRQDPSSSKELLPTTVDVGAGTWLCEASLWCEWTHMGASEATTGCKCMALNVVTFPKVVADSPILSEIAWGYARCFHSHLIAAAPPQTSWPNDVCVPGGGYDDIVVGMSASSQIFLSLVAVEILRSTWAGGIFGVGAPSVEKLEAEVRDRRSVLIMTELGEVQRVVAVGVVDLRRGDARLLAIVGKWKNSRVQASCVLPGSKMKEGELPEHVIQRLMATDLKAFAVVATVTGSEKRVEWKTSAQYGIKTKYIRYISKFELPDADTSSLMGGDTVIIDTALADDDGGLPVRAFSPFVGDASRTGSPLPVRAFPPFVGDASRAGGVGRGVLHRLLLYDVFVLRDSSGSSGGQLGAWLTPDEFDYLSSSDGEWVLSAWVGSFQVDEATISDKPASVDVISPAEGSNSIKSTCGSDSQDPTPSIHIALKHTIM